MRELAARLGRRFPPPAVVAAAVALVLLAGLATAGYRLTRPDLAAVVRALDGVDGLRLVVEHGGEQVGADPCRGSAMLQAERPRDALTREYEVAGGRPAGVVMYAFDFGNAARADAALVAAYRGLSLCRGYRAVSRSGRVFRFEYRSIEDSAVGARGYLVRIAGRGEGTPQVRTDVRAQLFRRGPFVVLLAWQSTGTVDETQLRCLAERVAATAGRADPRACSAAPVVSA